MSVSGIASFQPPSGAITPTAARLFAPAPLAGPCCKTPGGRVAPAKLELEHLTEGIPDPESIEEQKNAYRRSIELQFEQGRQSLQDQNAERKRILHEEAERCKQALILEVERDLKAKERALDEETHKAMLGLKKAALDQHAALQQQAAALTLEYNSRKMHEDFAASQADLQRQYVESSAMLSTQRKRQAVDAQARMQWQAKASEFVPPAVAGGYPGRQPAVMKGSIVRQSSAPCTRTSAYGCCQAPVSYAASKPCVVRPSVRF